MNTPASTESTARLELAAFVIFAAGVGLIQFSIKAEGFLAVAGLLWGVLAWRDSVRPAVPAFFVPLLVLAGLTLLGSALSEDPMYSLARSKQFLLFLIVPMGMRVASGRRASATMDVVIALGAAAALVGIVQWVVLGYDNTEKRPPGFLGHYMTYSGVLMLVVCAAVARLLFREREWVWPAVAVPALLVALGATLSRNVWVGTVVALGSLLALRSKKLLIALPVLLVAAWLVAPASVKERGTSMFDPNHASNRDRIAMLKAGGAMIKDHPLFGVGMNMVPRVYLNYRTADAVDSAGAAGLETRSHLHNVPMQLAAERGLPAMAVWLWFVAVAARDLLRLLKKGRTPAVAAAGFAAVIAMFVAGLFEHNFGDSEFLVLFLALITLPFAADRGDGGERAA